MAMMTLALLALAGCLLPAACTAESDTPETITDNREVPLTIGEVSLSASLTDEGAMTRGAMTREAMTRKVMTGEAMTRNGMTRAANPIDNLRVLYTFATDAGKSVRNNTLYKLIGSDWAVAAGSPILLDKRTGPAVGVYYTGTPENLAVSEKGAIKLEMQPYTSGKSNLWYFQKHTSVNNANAALNFNTLSCIYSMFRINIKVDNSYPGSERKLNKIVIKYGSGLIVSAMYNPFKGTGSYEDESSIVRDSYTVNDLEFTLTKNTDENINLRDAVKFFLPSQGKTGDQLTVILNIDGKDYTATTTFNGFGGMKMYTLKVTLQGTRLTVGGVEIDDWTAGFSGGINIE